MVKHIDSDGTTDVAVDIAAAKSIFNSAAIKVENHITSNIRLVTATLETLRTAKHIIVFTTEDVKGDIAGDVSFVGASINAANGLHTANDGRMDTSA